MIIYNDIYIYIWLYIYMIIYMIIYIWLYIYTSNIQVYKLGITVINRIDKKSWETRAGEFACYGRAHLLHPFTRSIIHVQLNTK